MQTGYYSNTGGMVTQFNRLDVISNNLANLNTGGYKRDDVVIGDFMRLYREQRDVLPLENNTKEGSQFLNRSMVRVPQVVEEYTDYAIGAMHKTGNPLDIALQQPDTFFGVLTPNGVRYTRNGSFNIDDQGQLVTKEGFPVLPADYFQAGGTIELPQDREFTVNGEGTIQYKNPIDLTEELTGQTLMVAKFDNIKYMEKVGNNLYKTDNRAIVQDGMFQVAQGFLEKSNVNPVGEMTALIETNRLVGMYQKVMDAHMNDLNSDAINKLGSIRG